MDAVHAYWRTALSATLIAIPLAAQNQTQYFTPPTSITELNTAGTNFSPTLTEDETYMVFASTRPGGLGSYDLYETSRPDVNATWSAPVALTQLNSTGADYEPNISYDGTEMYFVSTRAGGLGSCDIYVTTRPAPNGPWSAPVNIGAPVNGPGICNDDPYLTQNALTMFYTGPGAGGADIWTTQRSSIGSPWGPPVPFAVANSSVFDHSPLPEGNGEVVWFSSNRVGGAGGSSDFYMTTRDPQTLQYSAPVEIDDMNTTGWDSNGWRSGVTGRFYGSYPFGLGILCPRIVVVWVKRCLISVLIPVGIIWFPPPPRIIWRRVWPVSIFVPQIRIVWYRWFVWPFGGISALLASLAPQDPPIPANLILPGAEGAVLIGGQPLTMTLNVIPPGNAGGLEGLNLAIPPNPGLVGLELHLQNAGLDLGNNQLTLSEAGVIRLQ